MNENIIGIKALWNAALQCDDDNAIEKHFPNALKNIINL